MRESEITRLGELLVADRQTRTQAVRRADWEGGGMTGSHMGQDVLAGQTGGQRGETDTGACAIPSVFSLVACVCLHCFVGLYLDFLRLGLLRFPRFGARCLCWCCDLCVACVRTILGRVPF